MKIYFELDFASFEPWSGAVSTHKRIVDAGKAKAFEAVLEELYPDGMSKTELNDLLWFEPNTCYEWCGLRTESEIREELEAARVELEDLETEYRDECEDLKERFFLPSEADAACDELWRDEYANRAEEIKERIKELKEELEEI